MAIVAILAQEVEPISTIWLHLASIGLTGRDHADPVDAENLFGAIGPEAHAVADYMRGGDRQITVGEVSDFIDELIVASKIDGESGQLSQEEFDAHFHPKNLAVSARSAVETAFMTARLALPSNPESTVRPTDDQLHPKGALPESLEHGQALAHQFVPTLKLARQVLGPTPGLDLLANTTVAPPGRPAVSVQRHDAGFMTKVQQLVERGMITAHTLVISDTGHDIPILAQLTSNDQLRVQGHICFDAAWMETTNIETGLNRVRLRWQAQSWGNQIKRVMEKTEGPGALFIGLDMHRVSELPRQNLPAPDILREYGIDKVIYLQELPPEVLAKSRTSALREQLKGYCKSLVEAGLAVRFEFVEHRMRLPYTAK